ncbi:ribonuclease H-like domain-containing protein [Tanacetum coccineum]
MEAGTTSTTLTARLPILNLGEYDLWLIRIEQYFLMTDYSLWEVILNGNKVLKRTVGETEQEYEPTTVEEKKDMRNEMKSRGTLLMALPNKDQLKFHSYKDEKLLMEAIEKSTNSNSNNSTNEADNTTYGVSAAHTQSNLASGDNLSDAVVCAFLANRRFIKRTGRKLDVNNQRVRFDRSKVECYNCHKNGHFARECRAPRNQENRGRENSRRTVTVETPTENALVAQDRIGGSSNSDSEVDSCSKSCIKAYATLKEQYDSLSSDYKKFQFNLVSYKAGLESVEARLAHYKKNEAVFEESINVLNLEVKLRDNALVENKKKLEKAEKERDELKLTLEKFQNSSKSLNNLLESQVCDKFKTGLGYNAASLAIESFVNSSEMLENQEYNKSKSDKGYHAVPLPYTGNFIPSKPDLTFMDEIVESENMDVITIVTPSNVKKVESNHESADVKNNGDAVEPKTVRKNSFRPPVIEDWNSDDDSEVEFIPNVKDKTVRPSTKKIKFIKSARETMEKVETPKQNKHYPRGNHKNWNNLMSQRLGSDFKMINKACFVCGSFEHLHYVCDKKVIRPVWNNSSRVNHKNFANKMTHPHPNRRFVPQEVLTRSGKINTTGASVNTVVRPVNTAGSKTNKEYKEKGVIESGCSRHMTGNKCYLTEYEDYDGGFVSFRDENNVLFIDTECLVLSFDFKLLDESQVLLRVPIKDNIYSVDLKSVVPTKGLTCLFAKATINESNLWHRRLGDINFKNMNKLVRGNLVRENQLDYKVKVIRSDNGTEFKNSNGVAERRNRTLIEAARTMLVDSKLPTTFWAEAVNTACYVLNRVLVIKPHTKTPYELIRRRTPLIDFMKPFGYSVVSKAMRVFNKRTRIVEETLNIRFLENAPNVTGNGPDWLFDVDSLTISMNYVPVVAGNQTNGITGTRDNIVTCQAEKKT